jgi:Pentapeptide repeats (8 copies)
LATVNRKRLGTNAKRVRRDLLRVDVLALLLGLPVAGVAVYLLFDPDTRVAGASLLAALVVAFGTLRTVRVARESQVTQRFSEAVGQLGKGEDERLGGIYALERIARDSPRDHEVVIEVLTAYVRRRSPWPPYREERMGATTPENDVQAVIAVLGRRRTLYDLHDVDLKSTDLRGARFGEANLKRVNLEGANLEGAHLEDTKNLRKAKLTGATYDERAPMWPPGFGRDEAHEKGMQPSRPWRGL